MSPLVNHESRLRFRDVIHRYLRNAWGLLTEVLAPVVFFGTLAFQELIKIFLPQFESVIPSLWMLSLGTYIYVITFYSSTYAISHDKQSKILLAQGVALASQVLFVLGVGAFGHISIELIALSCVVKFSIYNLVHAQVLKQLSNGELIRPIQLLRYMWLRGLPILAGCLLSFENSAWVYAVLGVLELGIVYRSAIPRWKLWVTDGRELRSSYSSL